MGSRESVPNPVHTMAVVFLGFAGGRTDPGGPGTLASCSSWLFAIHDQFPTDRCANRSAHQGRTQASPSPVPQVPSHVPQRVGRRADLFSLQKHGCVAEGCTSAVPSCQQVPIVVRPRVSVQLAEDNPKCEVCRTTYVRFGSIADIKRTLNL